jgi:thymidylate synthase
MNVVKIEATTLEDAWFRALYEMIENGRVFKIDQGSYAGQKRLEFDYVVICVKDPGNKPQSYLPDAKRLLPQIPEQYSMPNPVEDEYIDDYLPYLMTDLVSEHESYTYGQRINKVSMPLDYIFRRTEFLGGHKTDEECLVYTDECWDDREVVPLEFDLQGSEMRFLSQVNWVIWTYKNKGYRNNQMVLQVANPTDIVLKDPPCLRHIDTRIQDGKLHFFPYFRSWDLWNGLPANLAAIQLLKEYMAGEIGVEDGEMVCASKGLHIYDYAFDLAKCLRMKEDGYKFEGE